MINLLHITFLLLVLATEATAERNYIIGARVDFASGISNRPGLNGTPLTGSTSKSLNTFYAPYPSVEIKTAGEHWNIELSYALGLTRMNTDLNLNSDTHAASARFSRSFKRWKLNLSESFETTPDITTFNALRGVAQDTDGGFRFLFYPVAARRSSQTNNTFVASEYTINEKSTLSISGSHTLRTYEEDPLFQGRVSDQSRVSAGIMYTRKYSEQSSWGIGYGWAHYGFKQFENGRSHGVNIEYSHQFDRSLTLQATVGPSHTEIESRGSYFSYNASLGLQKRIKSNSFSFSYHRSGGESSGYSSVSKTQQLRIGAARQLTKKMTASMEFSWFDSQAQAVSSYQTLGSAASAGMGWALNRTLSLNWGTEFQRYGGGSDTAFEQKRLFFSLRFDNPMLFRLSR